jgi:hypothetical protein
MPHRLSCEANLPVLSMEDACGILDALGPMPGEALAAMVDYGLSDAEIARYYGLSIDLIAILRAHWRIGEPP